MPTEAYKTHIRKLIAEDLDIAFPQILEIIDEQSASLDEVILAYGRYIDLKSKHSLGTLSFEEYQMGATRIRNTLLETIRKIDIKESATKVKLSHQLRLFQHRGFYPVEVEKTTKTPYLDKEIFMKAINYFLHEAIDESAVSDLIFLYEDNRKSLPNFFNDQERKLYDKLVAHYSLEKYAKNIAKEVKEIFSNYKRIVNDLGFMFQGLKMEILLHNIRNPLRSVIAAKNTEGLSNRTKGDYSTIYINKLIEELGGGLMMLKWKSDVSYKKKLRNGKYVKATTTPIYHEKYGLVGILCINIDIEGICGMSGEEQQVFFQNYINCPNEIPLSEKED